MSSLARPPPPAPPRRGGDQSEKERGKLVLSNRYAYGYGLVTLYTPAAAGVGGFGQEAEEAAKLEVHTVGEPDAAYEPVLSRLLKPRVEETEGGDREVEESMLGDEGESAGTGRRPVVVVLLSWKEPWLYLEKLRAWLQLLARAVEPTARPEEDLMDILKESRLNISLVVQHVEAQQALDREGWQEETFDYVSQVLRTAILPLHPASALLFTSSTVPPQQSGSALSETQKAIYQSLDLDLTTLSPRALSGSTQNRPEDLQAKHNVIDRMNIVVPQAWDSVGKIRLLSESFSPEEMLSLWKSDLSRSIFPLQRLSGTQTPLSASGSSPHATNGASRADEEVFEGSALPTAEASPISVTPSDTLPDSLPPSAIRAYESQIQDPNAHKKPQPPSITTITRPEQEFLAEMKAELDSLAFKDRERSAADGTRAPSGTSRPVVGLPAGESTGALNDLGDVSFNVGGVSYNTVSAEAAIERLKRPQVTDSSLSPASPRNITPRPPRRAGGPESRDATPMGPGSSAGKGGEFPSEDLERYFASLAKKAGGGGGGESRAGTPSRH